MSGQDKRRSERAIPFLSEEEVVVIHGAPNLLAKMMDLSDVGTLVYLLSQGDLSESTTLSICHQGKVFEIPATIARKDGQLVAYEFQNPSADAVREVKSKLIRMEVEWLRLSEAKK